MTVKLDRGLFSKPSVTLTRQTEISECGLACLTMIAGYHGLYVEMSSMRRRFAPSVRGVTLQSLIGVADRLGFTTRAVRIELEDIGALALPAILHWDLNHFVVLESVAGRRALIHDPAGASRWIGLDEVSSHFTGVALELEPAVTFEAGDVRRKLRLPALWTHIRGLKRAIIQIALLSAILQIFALVLPYYLQLAIDSALAEMNFGFMTVLAAGFGLFAIINGFTLILRSAVLLSVGSAFGYGLSSNLARKLMRLPVDWFGRRHVGDVLSRFQSIVPIRKLLAEDAPAALVDGALALLTLMLMFIYSPVLSISAVVALGAYALSRALMFRAQRSAEEEVIVATGREQSVLIETINGIRALRLAGREALRQATWQSRMTAAVNGEIRSQRITNWQTALQATAFTLENIISVWLAIGMIMAGGFSAGMLFAFLAYKAQFLNASASLINKANDFKMISLHLDRLSDIALSNDEIGFSTTPGPPVVLRGNIELKDVSFRYSIADPLILQNISLTIGSGESVAITGPSGGGKSTLAQIILGLVEATSGEVLVDGRPMRVFGHQEFHRQVAAVLQDDALFSGSLSDNISLFDDRTDSNRITEAAIAASIHDDIVKMPMGYETMIGEMGMSLSGGQRQRVLLARALYRQPRILVMDEGTSHLDESRERQVNSAIASMGITRIIIAHRRETIESAQRILYLDEGKLVELPHPKSGSGHELPTNLSC